MNLKGDVHEMITDQRSGIDYEGLSNERDTIDEVKSILQLLPDLIQRRKETIWVTNK